MVAKKEAGVQFPAVDGARSTTAFGRSVVGRALAPVDPVGSRAALAETSWRSGYPTHFRRLVEASVGDPEQAVASARAGLAAVTESMVWVDHDGVETPLTGLAAAADPPPTERITGSAAPVTHLALPYRGQQLRGDDLHRQLEAWVQRGVMEPGVATAVRRVSDHPEWLALPGHLVLALGVASEIGPAPVLLTWGATVAGVDVPRPDLWRSVLDDTAAAAGTLLVPARPGEAPLAERAGLADRAGLDLLTHLPELLAWADSVATTAGDRTPVVGNHLYADGGLNVRLAAAADLVATRLTQTHPETALAFLATPTDVFAVPGAAVEHSVRAYESRSARSKIPGRLLRGVSGGRLLTRGYLPGADPGICDTLVTQQGPNYILGKRLHRWRAIAARADGQRVSMNVAPPTRTRSVLKNKALAAAYAGAHRFGVEVFDADTTRTLMAALLVHDLMAEPVEAERVEPWRAEAEQAVHGGLWRAAYAPRSALGLAAALGYGAAR